MGSNPGLHGDTTATNRRRHGTSQRGSCVRACVSGSPMMANIMCLQHPAREVVLIGPRPCVNECICYKNHTTIHTVWHSIYCYLSMLDPRTAHNKGGGPLPLTFKRRIKSHLQFAGIIRSSPYSPRFQDKG